MKHILPFLCIAFSACTSEPKQVGATLVSIETPMVKQPQRAYNVGQTEHGVTAYYADSDAEFVLYFNQCAVIAYDDTVLRLDCEVYQTSPGVWVGDFGGGEFVKINTATGTTTLYRDGANRMYTKARVP